MVFSSDQEAACCCFPPVARGDCNQAGDEGMTMQRWEKCDESDGMRNKKAAFKSLKLLKYFRGRLLFLSES